MHLRRAKHAFVWTFSIIYFCQTNALPCPLCNFRCECSDSPVSSVTCQDLRGNIPQCLPRDIEELSIANSPGFTRIEEADLSRYKMLRNLSIVVTGLQELHKDALSQLDELQEIAIIQASGFTDFSYGTFSGRSKLKRVTVTYCPFFRMLQSGLFTNLSALQDLDLSYNAIEEVHEDVFDQTFNVQSLTLSYNTPLQTLPRKVFSRLENLANLQMSHCDLQVLYPEHVQTPYENGALTLFDGRNNSWQCGDMCEFITWSQNNPYFDRIAKMGLCASPEHLQERFVLKVDPSSVCFDANVVTRVMVGLLFVSVIAVTCCFLCAARHCITGMCCAGSSSTSPNENAGPGRDHRNEGYNETESISIPTAQDPVLRSNCNVGNWNINSIEPPSYEDVVDNEMILGTNNNEGILQNPGEDSFSIEIDPPPYEAEKIN